MTAEATLVLVAIIRLEKGLRWDKPREVDRGDDTKQTPEIPKKNDHAYSLYSDVMMIQEYSCYALGRAVLVMMATY